MGFNSRNHLPLYTLDHTHTAHPKLILCVCVIQLSKASAKYFFFPRWLTANNNRQEGGTTFQQVLMPDRQKRQHHLYNEKRKKKRAFLSEHGYEGNNSHNASAATHTHWHNTHTHRHWLTQKGQVQETLVESFLKDTARFEQREIMFQIGGKASR